MRSYLIACFLLLILADGVEAQQYRFHQYRVEQGLPSDVIKAVTQDSLGFFWIATDDGLVRYDGLRFITYKDAVPGQYIKGFVHTRNGKLLAYADLNVVEIINMVDTVVFRNFLYGERFETDSTLFFPKSAYEDKQGNLWFGEPKTVSRFDGTKITRYDFGEENRSTVFVRSFSFFEDNQGNLYATSYRGNLFKYSKADNKFQQVPDLKLSDNVSHAVFFDNKLLVAAREGLMMFDFRNGSFSGGRNLIPVGQVSHILVAADSSVFVSTYEADLYHVRFSPAFVVENLAHNFNGINSCYLSHENEIWASTDKGLVLVQKNLFVLTDDNSLTHFIEGIALDEEHDILYYCNKEKLVEVRKGSSGKRSGKVIEENQNHYFQSLIYDGEYLWASTRWEVLVFKNSKIIKRFDFSGDGNFVHDMCRDKDGNIWLSQAGSKNVTVISKSFAISTYSVDGLTLKDINVVREGRNGMYLTSSGLNGYLYFKSTSDSSFRNISVEVPFVAGTDFNVLDLAVDKNELLWLATTEGVLKLKGKDIERVNYQREFQQYPVSSIKILDADNLLFSNSFGLFRYNISNGEYWLYDENTGLPSNTITNQGIFISSAKEVFLGTSYGIAHATAPLLADQKTQQPYCIEARVNGAPTRFNDGVHATFGSFVTLRFSPISFPENRVIIQWRYSTSDEWRSVENSQLDLSDLKHGNYTIYFRAKKNTGYSWSEESKVEVIVQPPYWKKAEFIIGVLLLITVIAWGSYAVSAVIMNKRKEYLQAQINERTHELTLANEELKQRNVELDRFVYSASHDLSAPLKSILGLIRVAKMDDPPEGHREYLDMMERSVHKLELFIQEVVTYSRNARMPVRYERCDFKNFVKGLLQDHEYSDNYRKITFIVDDHLHERMITDLTRLKIILNNLLSNAIKFHWMGDGRRPVVQISLARNGNSYVMKVSDNGKGIPKQHIQRIFEMFYRATEDSQGSGLGLYILKESVVKLGGTVEAESVLEQGTTFTIKLPIPTNVPTT